MPTRMNLPSDWTPDEPDPVHMTPEGIERMHERLIRLKRDLPALSLEVQRTNAFGDRSENAEYQAAKRALRRAQGQIARLTGQLKVVQPIPTGPAADGTVRRGATVMLENALGEKREYRLVGPREANPSLGRISAESPLGTALIGKKSGDDTIIQTPGGEQRWKIIKIQ